MIYQYIFLPLISFVLTFFLIRHFISENSFVKIFDNPNSRSLHSKAIPRSGGIAIFSGALLPFGFYFNGYLSESHILFPLLGFMILAMVSLLDDIKALSPQIRITAHFLGSALFILQFFQISSIQSALHFGIIIFSVVWFINLYNFMDGLDGLCGSMSLSGFLIFGIIFFQYKILGLSLFCFIFAGAVIAFLVFNFPPAKIFMGDSGSIGIGYLFAVLSIYSINKGIFSPLIPLMLFLPFIYDASLTLAKRILRGEKPWQAHREHFYQRLATSRIGKLNTLYLEIAIIFSCGITVLILLKNSAITQFFSLFFLIIVLIIIKNFFVKFGYLKK